MRAFEVKCIYIKYYVGRRDDSSIMIYDITRLATLDMVSARDIDAAMIRPNVYLMSHPAGTPGRKQNGFMLVEEGECFCEPVLSVGNSGFTLAPGDIAYFPRGANYSLEATKHPLRISRVSFRLLCGDDEVLFSESPFRVLPDAGFSVRQICSELCSANLAGDKLILTSLLFRLLHEIIQLMVQSSEKNRVDAAVKYISSHFYENTPILSLASSCYLSEAQFFRQFRKATGMTPVAYRNKLRIEQAKKLLADNELSIGGISRLIGFENIYYFDRLFKKYTGMTPTDYRNILFRSDK